MARVSRGRDPLRFTPGVTVSECRAPEAEIRIRIPNDLHPPSIPTHGSNLCVVLGLDLK
jgi:hypothetical protein